MIFFFFFTNFARQTREINRNKQGGNASAQEVRQVCRGAPLEILRARSGRDKAGHPRAFFVFCEAQKEVADLRPRPRADIIVQPGSR